MMTPGNEKGVRPHLPERPFGCFAQMGPDPFLADDTQPHAPTEQQVAMAALADLRLANMDGLARATEEGVRQDLEELLTRLGKQIRLLSDKITENYLPHVQASRQLATLENGGLP